jgi:hypothetical protein
MLRPAALACSLLLACTGGAADDDTGAPPPPTTDAPSTSTTTATATATDDPTTAAATTDVEPTTTSPTTGDDPTTSSSTTGDPPPQTCAGLAAALGDPVAVCETGGVAICNGVGPATVDCDHCCSKPVSGSYWIDAGTHYPATGKGSYSTGLVPVMGSLLGVPEAEVYHRSLVHTQDEFTSWELRIGKGSQIYAIGTSRGQMIGQQVPDGVWIDRVLMTVAVASAKNSAEQPYFIHQAGTYKDADQGMTYPFWSPMFGVQDDVAAATYRTVVWPQQAHVYADIPWRSDVLLQQHVRDVGDGIVEITYVYTNYGEDTLDFIDLPWSGFARNAVPNYAESGADFGWTWAEIADWLDHIVPNTKTAGWVALAEQKALGSFALGIVYGRGPALSSPGQIVRYGPHSNEDLTVFESVPGATIAPGETYLHRYHLVFGRLSQGVHPYGNALAEHVQGLTLAFTPADVGLLDPCVLDPSTPACGFYTLDRPVPGARPVLLLRDLATDALLLSSDPYALSDKPYLGTSTGYLALLGWGVRVADDAPAALGMVKLSSLLPDPAQYPDPGKGLDVWVWPRAQ